MDRRTFLAGMGAALLGAPLTAEGQQAGRVYRIGYLGTFPPAQLGATGWNAFKQGLR